MATLLTSIEKGVCKKLKEKDVEIKNMNRMNRELAERIKQVAIEAQNWHYKAKYNEMGFLGVKFQLHQIKGTLKGDPSSISKK
ncbi:unnamed protein product [Lupinus luteus]|uniref:Uncharacterized protein n=1 Tax=Lupinus luteus TaxID=3873 RepID=A0AAV1W8M6_LUPLU